MTDDSPADGTTNDLPTDGADERPSAPEWPTVVAVVGPSGSGKTTLVESLCGAFERRVATVKSIHHRIEPDTPGTDTHRHRTAGADRVVGVTPSLTFEIARGGKGSDRQPESELAALRGTIARLARDGYDLVLVEGFSEAPIPAITVGDGETSPGEIVGTGDDSVEALTAAIDELDPLDPSILDGSAPS